MCRGHHFGQFHRQNGSLNRSILQCLSHGPGPKEIRLEILFEVETIGLELGSGHNAKTARSRADTDFHPLQVRDTVRFGFFEDPPDVGVGQQTNHRSNVNRPTFFKHGDPLSGETSNHGRNDGELHFFLLNQTEILGRSLGELSGNVHFWQTLIDALCYGTP